MLRVYVESLARIVMAEGKDRFYARFQFSSLSLLSRHAYVVNIIRSTIQYVIVGAVATVLTC